MPDRVIPVSQLCKRVKEATSSLQAAHALEYGCRPESRSFLLARNGASVVGIDISDAAIRMAQSRADAENLGKAAFCVMDAEKLALPDDSFDLIRGTPRLRTSDEHPLCVADLAGTRQFFEHTELRYFHLLSLLATPVQRLPAFSWLLRLLDRSDEMLFRTFPHSVDMHGKRSSFCSIQRTACDA